MLNDLLNLFFGPYHKYFDRFLFGLSILFAYGYENNFLKKGQEGVPLFHKEKVWLINDVF